MNGNVMQKGKLNRKFLRPFWGRCHQHYTKANKPPIELGGLNCVHLVHVSLWPANVENPKPVQSISTHVCNRNNFVLFVYIWEYDACSTFTEVMWSERGCTCEVKFGRLTIALVMWWYAWTLCSVNMPADANFHTWQSSHWCALILLRDVQLVSIQLNSHLKKHFD